MATPHEAVARTLYEQSSIVPQWLEAVSCDRQSFVGELVELHRQIATAAINALQEDAVTRIGYVLHESGAAARYGLTDKDVTFLATIAADAVLGRRENQ